MDYRKWYGLFALIWLGTGLLIWQYGHGWIRNYGGDILVVGFLMWSALVVRPTLPFWIVSAAVLIFAITIEVSQFFDLSTLRAMLGDTLSSLILGHKFDWLDILFYGLGLALCIPFVKWVEKRHDHQSK